MSNPSLTWDFQMQFTSFVNNLYHLLPKYRLCDNVGFDDLRATNTKNRRPNWYRGTKTDKTPDKAIPHLGHTQTKILEKIHGLKSSHSPFWDRAPFRLALSLSFLLLLVVLRSNQYVPTAPLARAAELMSQMDTLFLTPGQAIHIWGDQRIHRTGAVDSTTQFEAWSDGTRFARTNTVDHLEGQGYTVNLDLPEASGGYRHYTFWAPSKDTDCLSTGQGICEHVTGVQKTTSGGNPFTVENIRSDWGNFFSYAPEIRQCLEEGVCVDTQSKDLTRSMSIHYSTQNADGQSFEVVEVHTTYASTPEDPGMVEARDVETNEAFWFDARGLLVKGLNSTSLSDGSTIETSSSYHYETMDPKDAPLTLEQWRETLLGINADAEFKND